MVVFLTTIGWRKKRSSFQKREPRMPTKSDKIGGRRGFKLMLNFLKPARRVEGEAGRWSDPIPMRRVLNYPHSHPLISSRWRQQPRRGCGSGRQPIIRGRQAHWELRRELSTRRDWARGDSLFCARREQHQPHPAPLPTLHLLHLQLLLRNSWMTNKMRMYRRDSCGISLPL